MAKSDGSGLQRYDVPGIWSVLLFPGSGKAAWEGIGDAVLIDGQRGIFAVADGPERNPQAASTFLKRFWVGMSRLIDPLETNRLVNDLFDSLVSATNRLIRETAYHDGTTFSAAVFGHDRRFAVLHAGDSLIFRLRPGEGTALQLSRTNHCLVGRAPGLFQAETAPFREDDLLLVASDGLASLARSCGRGTVDFLEGLMKTCPHFPEMIEAIGETAHGVQGGLDDIGLVIVQPESLCRSGDDSRDPLLFPRGTGVRMAERMLTAGGAP
jgi:serine/threonine protein phosphatase PrpC